MGIMETNPTRSKMWAALVAVVVAAVVVTILRISSPAPVRVSVREREVGPSDASAQMATVPQWSPGPNPFKKPARLSSTADEPGTQPKEAQVQAGTNGQAALPWLPAAHLQIQPLGSGPRSHPQEAPGRALQEPGKPEDAEPTFILLATVKSDQSLYGVIMAGDSRARVVRVGDVLDGGFKVKELDVSHAVLTNGRDTLIAKRRHLQDDSVQKAGGS